MTQAQAVLIEEQDRAAHARELRFDQAHEAIEHLGERRARRDHFENLRLASRSVSAILRAVMSREIPTRPTTSPASSVSGTFVVETQTFPPSGPMTYSSISIRGRPVFRMRRSSARYLRAAAAG